MKALVLPLALVAAMPLDAVVRSADDLVAGRRAGPPADCIAVTPTSSPTTFDGVAAWRDGGTVWVNHFNGQCRFLHADDALVMRSFTGQLCRGDIVTTRDPLSGLERGPCALGPFERYGRSPGAR